MHVEAGPHSPVDMFPHDAHNARLLANTHPREWHNPEPRNPYNLVVIGAGTAGLVSAIGAAGLGARVALIEQRLMGGDCLNYGCVPSKGLIRCATARADVQHAGDYGIRLGGEISTDFSAVMERMRRVRADISHNDSVHRCTALGIDIFLGSGRFTGPRQVEVDGARLRFAKAVIATGGHATGLPIPGLEATGYLTNETVFSLTEQPPRLGIIGAGPIGCEMAQTFQRLGSHVTLFEAETRILPREDAEAAEIVHNALRRDGVHILPAVKLEAAARHGDDTLLRYVDPDGQRGEVSLDAILVSVGRAPNVKGLGLEAAGVAFDARLGVHVDDRLRTTNRRIFAAGDICSRYQFTHAADFLARTVIANALFMGRQKASALTIPWCTYTDPQIAHVGLTAHQAAANGIALDTFTQPLAEVDRAMLDGETAGFAKVQVKKGTDTILGATVIARNAGDIISVYTTAMTHGLGLGALAKVIQPYPTQAEVVRKTGDLYNRTRLTPRVKQLMTAWLQWQRGR